MTDTDDGAAAPRGQGVSFPRVDGSRSTTATGRAVFEAAARAVDTELGDRIAGDREWHKGYLHHVRDLCEAELLDPAGSEGVPDAGLRTLHERFTFVRDGDELPLATAVADLEGPAFTTVTVEGRGEPPEDALVVPYRGDRLRDEALDRQLQRWTDAGTVEPSFAEVIRRVMDEPAWLDLSGHHIALLGADNARVAMAVDALTVALLDARDDVSLAMLATPTDVYAAPPDAVEASMAAARSDVGGLQRAARTASRGRLYAPNYDRAVTTPDGRSFGIADSLVTQQGPNYLLAKRLQRWRARHARGSGVRTSANVAPATRTHSVMKNRVLAAAYAGASRFGVEIFEPDTSNTLMAALLVHDLRHNGAVANPDTRLGHPLELFAHSAAHGGLWRIPFAPRSVLPIAALLGLTGLGRR